MKLGRYLEVLRAPGVARVAAFATMGRLPFAIVPLSIVLLMREEGYHYGQIGAVVGAESLAVGLTAGFVGRLVDRAGRRRVILVTGATTTLFLCAETLAILSDAPVWLLVVLAALQGATIPPISASMRSLWARLVPEETLESAYAFDAIQLELVFVVGPLIAAGLATALSPAVGMLLCAGFYVLAAAGFATAPAARAAVPEEHVERSRAGALRSPGMRTLVLAGAITAISFGALEVALTAFAEAEGSRAAVGPLVTVWAIGSVIGGLWYGGRSWRAPIEKRFLVLMALLGLGSAPLPFAPSIGVMAVLLVPTGLALAAARHHRVRPRRPAGARRDGDGGLLLADRRERHGSGRRLVQRPACSLRRLASSGRSPRPASPAQPDSWSRWRAAARCGRAVVAET